jgi:hypothetical protein
MAQLLAVVHNLIPPQVSLCVRAFLDFYIQITSKEHTDDTLAQANEYLNLFFGYLPIFQDVTSSSLNFPKIHMLTKYANDIRRKGPVDGYSTNHGERLHKSQAKGPTKRTNQRNMKSFTRQLAQFIQDRDSFYDMYPNTTIAKDKKPPLFHTQPLPTSTSFSATITATTTEHSRQYSFRSVQAKYKQFSDLKNIISQMSFFKSNIRLYLNTVIDNNSNAIRISKTPNIQENIQVYNEVGIVDLDDDFQQEKEKVRTGDYISISDNDTQRYF